jgi:hypothetical protein
MSWIPFLDMGEAVRLRVANHDLPIGTLDNGFQLRLLSGGNRELVERPLEPRRWAPVRASSCQPTFTDKTLSFAFLSIE